MWVQSLGQEVSQEKEMATCSRILAWKIPWGFSGAWQARVHGVTKSQTGVNTHVQTHTSSLKIILF